MPTTHLPSVFVSSKNEEDEDKVKQLLIEQVKSALTFMKKMSQVLMRIDYIS